MSDYAVGNPESDLLSFPREEPAALLRQQAQPTAAARPQRPPMLRDHLPVAPSAPKPIPIPMADSSDERARGSLGLSLGELRTVGTRLVHAYGRLEEQYKDVDGRSTAALETLASIERRVGSLEILRDLSSTIDERFASLTRIRGDLDVRTGELRSQEAVVDGLEGRATKAMTDARAADSTFADLERRFGPTAEEIDRRTRDVGTQETRLAEIRAVTRTTESDLERLEARIEELAVPSPALLAARANVEQLQRLAVEASAQLDGLRSEKDALKRVLDDTRADLVHVRAQVRRLSFVSRFRRAAGRAVPRVVGAVNEVAARVWRTVDWESVRSADTAPGLVFGLGAVVLIALVAPAVLRGPAEPLEATAQVEPVEPTAVVIAPRTSDIHLPAARVGAKSPRAGSERSRRSAAGSSR